MDIVFYPIQPFRALNQEEARAELDERKVRPAYTEEFLRFCMTKLALDTTCSRQIGGVVALNAYRDDCGVREYLCLDRRLDGNPALGFWHPEPTFPGTWAFLGVRP